MTQRLHIGDRVAVRSDCPAHHHRTPWFVKGGTGRIESISGPFLNPESRAYGGDGLPKQALCTVAFRQGDIWGAHYRENPDDCLLVDIYEHWLELATQ